MPAPARIFLVVAACTLAWRVRQAAGEPVLALMVLAAGAIFESRWSARFAKLARRQPDRADLATAPALRWLALIVGGAAALLWLLSLPRLLGGRIPVDVAVNLLAIAYPAPLAAAHWLLWPEASLVASRAWRHRVRPLALAQLTQAATIVLPKVGVLTVGRPRLVALHRLRGDLHEGYLLSIAAGLLAGDRTDAAEAVRQATYTMGLMPAAIERREELAGLGSRGLVANRSWSLGGRPLAAQCGFGLETEAPAMIACQAAGGSALVLLDETGPVGWLEVADPPRLEVAGLLESLRAGGAERLVLLCDDEPAAAERLRQIHGFDEVVPRVSPGRLAELVHTWSAEGPVALFGHPAREAAAIAAADVSVALLEDDDEPTGELWLHRADTPRMAVPWLAARGAYSRSERLRRTLFPLSLLVVAIAAVGAPLPLVLALEELLVLATLAAFARRAGAPLAPDPPAEPAPTH